MGFSTFPGSRDDPMRAATIAVAFGFIGVMIILRPGVGIFDIKIFIPLLGAFFLSLYQITTRLVSYVDKNETSLFFTSVD